jgi:D-hydroxyproline dehydrogenase subunit gamma
MSAGTVTIQLDGKPLTIAAGGSLAAALLQVGIRKLRSSPRDRAPRGAFCLMGVCQECVVLVDGTIEQACLVEPLDGMTVTLGGAP